MEKPYGSEWPKEEKVKCREMVAPEAHYVFVHEVANSNVDEMTTILLQERLKLVVQKIVAPWLDLYNIALFLEEEIPVLYVYELQLEPRVQGKGVGKFLMQLVELMAQKVMLNCFSHRILL